MTTRRQATLYLQPPASERIEALRARFNPVQFALIRAHVTLCREDEVNDWKDLAARLEALVKIHVPLTFGAPVREADLVTLPAIGPTEEFDELRGSLLSVEGVPARKHKPHITLVHPRNGSCSDADFATIRAECHPFTMTFRVVTIIEQVEGGRWNEGVT